MKKYPFVKQEGIKDCGVASLQMIIQYYKGYISLEELRDMTKTNQDGTTAYNLIDVAKKIGFDAKGVKCKFDVINKENIILPCIASVIIEKSYLHFLVIYEIDFKNKLLIIGDPASKLKRVSFDYFKLIFNDVLIMLTPLKPIPIHSKTNIYKFFFDIIKNHRKLLGHLLILSVFVTIFSIINSFYMQYIIDSIKNYSKTNLFIIFYIFFSICALKGVSDYFRNKILMYINQKLNLSLMTDSFNKIIKLPYHYYKNRTTGEIISRFNDLDSVRDIVSKVALAVFIDLPLTIISLIFLYLINHTLFIISICILVLYIIVFMTCKFSYAYLINDIHINKGMLNSYMVESLNGFETIKGLHLEHNVIDKFEKKYVKLLGRIFDYHKCYSLAHFFKDSINDLGFILIGLVGALQVINGKMSLGSLITFNALLTYFLEPIRSIVDLDSSIKDAKNSLKRIADLFTSKEEKAPIVTPIKGDIVFKRLNFSFNNRDKVLNNINLNIKKGSKVIVLGKSGSGKSTLFKLLMKYYTVDMNKIFIDEVDINNYQKEALNGIVYLSQNEILFTDSVYNNINIDNSDQKIFLNVCKMCYVDEIINKNNLGYNMIVEENGFNISGGEKQRIILARTLLRPFEVLIIDEGTNQIDINLERKILKNILKNYHDKTIVFISHRLDNVDLFDNLVEIDNGKIVRSVIKSGKY